MKGQSNSESKEALKTAQ